MLSALLFELYRMKDIVLKPPAVSALHYFLPDGDSYVLEKY